MVAWQERYGFVVMVNYRLIYCDFYHPDHSIIALLQGIKVQRTIFYYAYARNFPFSFWKERLGYTVVYNVLKVFSEEMEDDSI